MDDQPQGPEAGTPDLAQSTAPLSVNDAAALFAKVPDQGAQAQASDPAVEQPRVPAATAEAADPGKPESTDSPSERTVTFKDHEGKDVTLKESDLVNGYKAQKASTEKYEAAAALRKQAEVESAKAREERQKYAAGLQQAQVVLMAAMREQEKQVGDWHRLREENPTEFLKQWHLFNERQAAFKNNEGQRQQLAAAEQHEQRLAFTSRLQSEHEKLLAQLPEWKNPEKMTAEHGRIAKDLIARGFTEEHVFGETLPDGSPNPSKPGITDHRLLLLARDAMLYREMMAKAKAAADKVTNLPTRVERPGGGETNPLDGRTVAMKRLGQSGSVQDAAAAFKALRTAT